MKVSNETKIFAQIEYCKKNNISFSKPKILCLYCYRDMWEVISLEKASTQLIHECPYCGKNFYENER